LQAEAEVAITEGVRERIVQHRCSDVEEGLRRCPLFQRICCFLFMRLAMISLTKSPAQIIQIAPETSGTGSTIGVKSVRPVARSAR
jgi:hypothetical protein